MKPAQSSYLAWRMKSAESSAGVAPSLLTMQWGALSMMSGMPSPYLSMSSRASRLITGSASTSEPSGSTSFAGSRGTSGK